MRLAALLVVALVVLACAGGSPTQTSYLLGATSPGSTGRVEAPVRVALGRIAVAPYLDQVGIVVETDEGQVRAARLHRWAEPLPAGIRSSLRVEISAALGYDVSATRTGGVDWDFVVDVNVERFHGTMRGTAVLDVSYVISRLSGRADVSEYRFGSSLPLPQAGYPGVVEAEAALVRELARSIANALRELAVR